MVLSSTYLGFDLKNPLLVGASPLTEDLGMVRRLEDNGASALVMHSLFEEQLAREQSGTLLDMERGAESYAEALSYFPQLGELRLGPENYLEQIRKIKAAVGIPVIASLNGTTALGWLDYARQIQEAGADALELNVYYLATNPMEMGEAVEDRAIEIVQAVRRAVQIPIAVKLSPFYSSLANMAKLLEGSGADALVLFNRFYQPDIDLEALEAVPSVVPSGPSELLLRLRWLAILYGQVRVPLAASGGVRTGLDALKAVMAGATAVQVVGALLERGPAVLKEMGESMERWMEEHEYASIAQMRGSMSLQKCANPAALERAHYMRALTGWRAS